MDIPLHPAVVTEMGRGREFLDRISAARRSIENTRLSVPSPDGDCEIVFGGDGMVLDAAFAEDVFDRYPGDKLSDLLTVMCGKGFGRVSEHVTDAVAGALRHDELR